MRPPRAEAPSRLRVGLQVLWPAFLMAGVAEMLVFAVVDPQDLRWFGGPAVGWPPVAVYTVSFLLLWLVTATSGALTALLLEGAGTPPDRP